MIAATATWAAGSGWSPGLPVPPDDSVESDRVVAIAFADRAAITHPDQPLAQLAAAWSGRSLVGCSTAGQVLGDRVLDHSVVVVTLRFASATVRCAHADLARSGSARRAGRELAEALAVPGLAAVLVLADGLSVNGTALAEGVADVLPDVPLAGALAADGDRFERTTTIVDGALVEGHATALGIVGDGVELGFGSQTGWQAFGPDRLVTRSFGNVLYELDGAPASDVYAHYLHHALGGAPNALPNAAWWLPLAVSDLDGRTVLRTARALHETEGSLTFTGDVAQGSTVRLGSATVDGLVHAAEIAAKEASTGHDEVVLVFGSAGRRALLGERSEDELAAVAAAVTPGATIVGFYGFGELAPVDGCNDVRDQSMTIVAIGERTSADGEET
jgi:hypothetical protein